MFKNLVHIVLTFFQGRTGLDLASDADSDRAATGRVRGQFRILGTFQKRSLKTVPWRATGHRRYSVIYDYSHVLQNKTDTQKSEFCSFFCKKLNEKQSLYFVRIGFTFLHIQFCTSTYSILHFTHLSSKAQLCRVDILDYPVSTFSLDLCT